MQGPLSSSKEEDMTENLKVTRTGFPRGPQELTSFRSLKEIESFFFQARRVSETQSLAGIEKGDEIMLNHAVKQSVRGVASKPEERRGTTRSGTSEDGGKV